MKIKNTFKESCSTLKSGVLLQNKGSALLSVLVIGVWLSILLLILIGVTHFQIRLIQRSGHRIQAEYLARAGIHRHLAMSGTAFGRKESIRSFRFEQGQAKVKRWRWGAFWRYVSIGESHHQKKRFTALCGQEIPESYKAAVILGHVRFPLILAGEVEIHGKTCTGPGGVRAGRLDGKAFAGSMPRKSDIITSSNPKRPQFDPTHCLDALADLQTCRMRARGRRVNGSLQITRPSHLAKLDCTAVFVSGDIDIDVLVKEKSMPACTLMAGGSIRIHGDFSYHPWTVLYAHESIDIQGGSWQHGLLACEKSLRITGPLHGSLQALSRDKIDVTGPAELSWPSVLAVDTQNSDRQEPVLALDGDVFVCGSILIADRWSATEKTGRNRILIGNAATVHGVIYTPSWCEFHGRLYGCLVCAATWLYRSPTTYINWIADGYIDAGKLEQDFILPVGFDSLPVLFAWQKI